MNHPVRIVLVETTHPGNIGAAARAIRTMGFHGLAVVAPREPAFLAEQGTPDKVRAAGTSCRDCTKRILAFWPRALLAACRTHARVAAARCGRPVPPP